jgi:dipeptidyl aminopeptidase/acylaminoacyl peptidase
VNRPRAELLVLFALAACGAPDLARNELPDDPIAFIQQRASAGALSLDALRAALRIENPDEPESLRPRLRTTLSLLVPSTGEVRALPDAQPGDLPLDWSADGARLLVGKSGADARRLELHAWNRWTGAWARVASEPAVSGAALADGPIRSAWGARVRLGASGWVHGVRAHLDGQGVVELEAARGGVDPDVAPDGRTLLFVRSPRQGAQRASAREGAVRSEDRSRALPSREDGVIVQLDPASGEARALARGSHPRFSRDGRWIAFTRRRGDQRDVWLMRADGSARRAITDTALYDEEYPALSPDGAYVVYASARGNDGHSQLYLTRRAGGRELQLTSHGQSTRPVW